MYPNRTKAEVGAKFEEFVKLMSAKTEFVVRQLRGNNGGEYMNKKMSDRCERLKISQEFTVPYHPEQNGLVERFNHILCKMVRFMLKDSQMDKKYWPEAFKTAAYLRNMINNPVNQGKSPCDATMKIKPNLAFMRVLGCVCFAHVPKERRKFDDTAVKCKILGNSEDPKAYRVMNQATGDVFNS